MLFVFFSYPVRISEWSILRNMESTLFDLLMPKQQLFTPQPNGTMPSGKIPTEVLAYYILTSHCKKYSTFKSLRTYLLNDLSNTVHTTLWYFYFSFSFRYLSLHDNKFIRYFTGHTKKVISLQMSPVDDTFMSGSLDNTVRLWDLRSPTCAGLMNVNGKPVCAFDPEGNQHQKAMSGASSTSSQQFQTRLNVFYSFLPAAKRQVIS